jgi:hypothetical protein
MANWLYQKGRSSFARGDISWSASGGDTIRCMLVDSAGYTPDSANDEFFDDVPATARFGNSGSSGRTDMPTLTLLDPSDGICDANDITFTSVPSGSALEYLVIFKDTGTDATSDLLACIDTATGLPVTPNGGDINVAWDSGTNKIFKL